MTKIFLQIEVSKREEDSRLLLGLLAAEDGHEVYLGDTVKFIKENTEKTGVFHHTFAVPKKNNLEFFEHLKKNNFIITSQDEEAGIEQKNFDGSKPFDFLKLRYSDKTFEYLDGVFTWGPFDSKEISNKFAKYKSKIFNTGSPRADLWKDKFSEIYKNKSIKNSDGYILITSNFGTCLAEKPIWSQMLNLRLAYFEDEDNNDYEYFAYEAYANKTKLLGNFIKILRKILKKFKSENFILRPHPSESIKAWKDIVGEYPNLIIEKKYNANSWIRNCKALMHLGCLTAVEAAAMKKEIIFLNDIENKTSTTYFNNLFGYEVNNFNDLENILQKILNKNQKSKIDENLKLLKERVYFDDDLSSVKILKTWNNLIDKNNLRETKNSVHNLWKIKLLIGIHKLKLFIKYILWKCRILKKNTDKTEKFDEFNLKNLKSKIKNFKDVLKLSGDFDVQVINSNLCRIFKK